MDQFDEKQLLKDEARKFFTKPFNLEHAKAGAPFCGNNGEAVQVLVWDRKHPTHPIVAMEGDGEQEVIAFRADGTTDHNHGFIVSLLVMTPLGYIDGKPVFMGDSIISEEGKLVEVVNPGFPRWERCRWPEPEKQYPVTAMSGKELENSFNNANAKTVDMALKSVANAALRHAIDSGQLPTKEAYDQCSSDLGKAERLLETLGWRCVDGDWHQDLARSLYCGVFEGHQVMGQKESIDALKAIVNRSHKRDLEIAQAVRIACEHHAVSGQFLPVFNVDLAAIIAKVLP